MKWFLLFFVIFIGSCHIFNYRQKPDKTFIRILNDKVPIDTNIISLNGFFTLVSYNSSGGSKYYNPSNIIDPHIFFGNNLFCPFEYFVEMDKNHLTHLIRNKRDYMSEKIWGVFQINDSLIESVQYIFFNGYGGNRNSWFLGHFKGTLINKNRIQGWQMVPPYPNFSDRDLYYNQEYLNYLKTPKDFEFVEFPEKREIDSNAVWINKYRKKRKE